MTTNESKHEQLLIAVVQSQDSDLVDMVLSEQGQNFTRLPSTGGFLREKNVTFLIGCQRKDYPKIKEILINTAKKRVTFITTPSESGPVPIPVPIETVVGGVTLLGLDIDEIVEM